MNYDVALDKQAQLYKYWNPPERRKWLNRLFMKATPDEEFTSEQINYTNDVVVNSLSGEPYYVAPNITDMVYQASQSIPTDWELKIELFMTKTGFVWFDRFPLVTEIKDKYLLAAISWTTAVIGSNEQKNLFYVIWGEWVGERVIQPITFLSFYKKQLLADSISAYPEIANTLKFFASFLLFINQTILVYNRRRPSRSCSRRVGKLEPTLLHEINVITLRRAKYKPSDSHVEVEWSCQWVVRGHWRNQYYPSTDSNTPIWILPYIKGPEDKPMKNSEHIFQVIR
jgi:hypothetical protein